jgi:hypothetical protein
MLACVIAEPCCAPMCMLCRAAHLSHVHQQGPQEHDQGAAAGARRHHAGHPLPQLQAPAAVRGRLACTQAVQQGGAYVGQRDRCSLHRPVSPARHTALAHMPFHLSTGQAPAAWRDSVAVARLAGAAAHASPDPYNHSLAHRSCRTAAGRCTTVRWRWRPRCHLAAGPPGRVGRTALRTAAPPTAPPCGRRWSAAGRWWCLQREERGPPRLNPGCMLAGPRAHPQQASREHQVGACPCWRLCGGVPSTGAAAERGNARKAGACWCRERRCSPKTKATAYQPHSDVEPDCTLRCAMMAISMPGGCKLGASGRGQSRRQAGVGV